MTWGLVFFYAPPYSIDTCIDHSREGLLGFRYDLWLSASVIRSFEGCICSLRSKLSIFCSILLILHKVTFSYTIIRGSVSVLLAIGIVFDRPYLWFEIPALCSLFISMIDIILHKVTFAVQGLGFAAYTSQCHIHSLGSCSLFTSHRQSLDY